MVITGKALLKPILREQQEKHVCEGKIVDVNLSWA